VSSHSPLPLPSPPAREPFRSATIDDILTFRSKGSYALLGSRGHASHPSSTTCSRLERDGEQRRGAYWLLGGRGQHRLDGIYQLLSDALSRSGCVFRESAARMQIAPAKSARRKKEVAVATAARVVGWVMGLAWRLRWGVGVGGGTEGKKTGARLEGAFAARSGQHRY
jgi:hypothetical protein